MKNNMARKLYKPVAFLNQPGPRVEPSSLKVLKHGKVMRLSSDIVALLKKSKRDADWLFLLFIYDRNKELVLRLTDNADEPGVLRAWQSNPGYSESILLSSAGILQRLGLDESKAAGSYRADIIEGDVHIYFNDRL